MKSYESLMSYIDEGDLVLYVPLQTLDEYRRNRENKIAAALKSLKDQKLNLQFPALCKDYQEYALLRNLQKEFEKQHSSLVKQILEDIENNSLKGNFSEICKTSLKITYEICT